MNVDAEMVYDSDNMSTEEEIRENLRHTIISAQNDFDNTLKDAFGPNLGEQERKLAALDQQAQDLIAEQQKVI